MQEWQLKRGDLLSITLAADSRFGVVDYTNDQTWELVFQSGEPLAVAVQTTFGLKARIMRIFPIFNNGNENVINPASFYRSPQAKVLLPNYAQICYSPFTGIDVVSEYWVPNSQSIACRTLVTNTSVVHARIRLDWAALLAPLDDGQGMTCTRESKRPHLAGRTQDLTPVFYQAGDVECSNTAFPGLSSFIELAPGNKQQTIWVEAARSDYPVSLDLARSIANRPWDAEIARIELMNQSQQIEIETGDPDWNLVFALSARAAFSLLVGSEGKNENPLFVSSRQPDRNPSDVISRNIGLNFSGLHAYYLASQVLPGASKMIPAWVRQLIGIGNQVDASGFKNKLLQTPILAQLAWKVFQIEKDETFLAEIFPDLLAQTLSWFDPAHDRDGDGFPEWDNLAQTGFYDHYLLDRNQDQMKTDDISTVESPSLGAFLFSEINVLSKMAKVLGLEAQTEEIESKLEPLKQAVEATWDLSRATYGYRERDSHKKRGFPGDAQEDITLLLPMRAHIPHHRRADSLVKRTICNPEKYNLPFGMPACPPGDCQDEGGSVHLIWNQLVIEGLLSYGYHQEAADLFNHLMGGITQSLQKRGAFSQRFDARTGDPSGERNPLDGLAPLGLFLDILGIKILSPLSLIIEGFSPFSWPVTVKYRGLLLTRHQKTTDIIFPDGQKTTISGADRQFISLS